MQMKPSEDDTVLQPTTEEQPKLDTSRQSTRSTIKEITLGSEELDRKAYDILSKKLHPQAESLVRTLVDDFATTLVYQAKLLAFRRKDEVVLSNHILDSVDIVRRERQRGWTREIIIFVGSALFGAFIPGILTEFGRGPEANFLLMGLYILAGFLGILMASWGLRRN